MLAWCYLTAVILLVDQVAPQFYIARYKTFMPDEKEESRRNDDGKFQRRQLLFSTFNPFTPGGTIYLAFMFLMPLTIGKVFGRSNGGNLIKDILEREGESLYNEMGYIDGNALLAKAFQETNKKSS